MTPLNEQSVHFRPAGLVGIGPALRTEGDFENASVHVNPWGVLGLAPIARRVEGGIEDRYNFRPQGLLGLGPLVEHRVMKQASVPVSPTLRAALRDHGWWKLASQVKAAQGLAPPAAPTLPAAAEALAMKIAADRATHRLIREGLDALSRVRGAR